jgi:hypothetical protein
MISIELSMTLPQVRLARHSRIDSLWPWRMRRTEWPVAPPRRGLVRR